MKILKINRLILTFFIVVTIILTGCGNDNYVEVSPDFDASPDLSLYIIEEEPAPPENIVEYHPNLEYVDTHFLNEQFKGVSQTSSGRINYEQPMPEWGFVLVDSRPHNVYIKGHINGAINIPDAEFAQHTQMLPDDKDQLLIFYCGGLSCELSAASAIKAIELGYTNVKVYQEGTPYWQGKGNYLVVTEEYIKDLIMETYMSRNDLPPFYLLDARPYSSYFKSHIPNSMHLDNTQYLVKYTGYLPIEKDALIITYCGGFDCIKSHSLAEDLMKDGYTNVRVFAGGLPAWENSKLPTFGTEGIRTDFDVSAGKVNRGLQPTQFAEKMTDSNTLVLDVRSAAERANGAINGSINIPDVEIHANPAAIAEQLPADKTTTILIHCASGARAGGVVDKIVDLGYPNTFYLDGRITIDKSGNYAF